MADHARTWWYNISPSTVVLLPQFGTSVGVCGGEAAG